MVMDVETASQRISEAGLRMTRPREILLNLVFTSSGPFSVKMLHDRAEQAGLAIHLATVHRNLNEFVSLGLVDELPGDDNRLYALHQENESGAHVYCIDCRALVPFTLSDAEAQSALVKALLDQGFDASSMRLMLSVHCKTHQEQNGQAEPKKLDICAKHDKDD
jgi:Fur family ferric uptake transcriptional regulator